MSREDLHARVEDDYAYVRDPKKAETFEKIRLQAKILSHLLIEVVPVGRELSTALTKVEEACMWGSAGIARAKKP